MDLKNYARYTLDDYLEDPAFRSWVFQPDRESDEFWEAVFNHYPEQQAIAQQARLLLQKMADFFQPAELREQAIDEGFVRHLQQKMQTARRPGTPASGQKTFKWRLSLAAAILFLIGMASWYWYAVHGNGMEVVKTRYAEWKTHQLPDGSTVQLNANSELRFAGEWQDGSDREVWLQGEAYFEVVHDPQDAKFTVYTDDIAVEVLGTSFNVHSRGDETKIFLKEGSVRLDLGKEKRMMEPGDLVTYSAKDQNVKTLTQEPEEPHTSWKDGSLIVNHKPVAEIVEILKEIFGYEVTVENEALLQRETRLAIPMDKEKIEEAIEILEATLQTEITLEDQIMIIH